MQPSSYERLLIAYARYFPIRRGKMRVIDALWQSASGDRGAKRVAKLRHAGFEMPCDLSEMLQRQFYFFGTYFLEEHNLDCWHHEARGAKIVFDVGANAGIYSLAALAAQPDATVHAFEPTPEIADRLRETAQLNELCNLHVYEVAVHSANDFATLHRFRDKGNEGMNFIRTGIAEKGAERIRTISLDQFCADNEIDHIDLLKLDIQGHENSALAGARHLLAAGCIGTIFIELNWGVNAGVACPASESIRLLEEAGYSFSKPRIPLIWEKSGKWLSGLSDVVARRIDQEREL